MAKFSMQVFGKQSTARTIDVPRWNSLVDIVNAIYDPKLGDISEVCSTIADFHHGPKGIVIDIDGRIAECGFNLFVYITLEPRECDYNDEGEFRGQEFKWDIIKVED